MSSTQFLELIVSLSLQAILVVSVTYWLGKLVENERVKYHLWTLCNTMLLLLLLAAIMLPHFRIFRPWSALDVASSAKVISFEIQFGQLLFYVWFVGVAVSLGVFVYCSWQLRTFLKSCEPIGFEIHSEKSDNILQNIISEYPLNDQYQFMKTKKLTSPFCYQFHKPYVVLPEYLLGLDQKELGYIIRHEIEHLRTGHPLHLFLQRLVEVLFWFHPVVWWASNQSAACREFSCDVAAIDSTSDVSLYLRTLLMIVEYGASAESKTLTPLAFGRGKKLIVKRAENLVYLSKKSEMTRKIKSQPARLASLSLILVSIMVSFIWVPADALASSRTYWSPFPTWSAEVLHNFGVPARDFEIHEPRFEFIEQLKLRQNNAQKVSE